MGTIGSAYVAGLESAGIVATLKHFMRLLGLACGTQPRAGVDRAARVRGRDPAPFEMALRTGVRSVMNSYADNDGVPAAADAGLFTDLLRGEYGFTGTVVSDYFSVAFLHKLHGVAAGREDAAAQALTAGIDVELPTVDCFGEPLLEGLYFERVDVALVDRALTRVLTQKVELGLLDPGYSPRLARISTWTTRSPARSPARWPNARSCCCRTTACCRWRASAWPSWDRGPTSPAR